MTTYVLVHGAAHGGWCYDPVAERLRAAGHEVHAPTLTGDAELHHLVTADVDLAWHVDDVVRLLEELDLRDVVLVGHSYGGMVITGAADRALDRVRRLVFLDACQPHDGESVADLIPEVELLRRHGREVDGVELILWPDNGHTYGVTDPEVGAWMLERLTPHPWRTFEQPLHLEHEAAVLALPRTSITCRDTLERRPAEAWMGRAATAEQVWHVDTGHDLMLSEPDEVAELLLRLA